MTPRNVLGTCAALGLTVAFAACGGNGDETTPATVTTTTATIATATAAATTTTPAGTPSPGGTGTLPTAEGTIDPLNAGQTDDWAVKANPDPAQTTATLVEVRLGVHPEEGGWERIVFEFDGAQLPAALVGYVSDPAQCGSGQPIELDGGMVLGVLLRETQAHNEAGQATVNVSAFDGPGNTIIEGVQGCDFEGHVDWFLGLKGEQRFKIITLQNPTRLVVDVKQ